MACNYSSLLRRWGLVIVAGCLLGCTGKEVKPVPGMELFWLTDNYLLAGPCFSSKPREVLKLQQGSDEYFTTIDYSTKDKVLIIAKAKWPEAAKAGQPNPGRNASLMLVDPVRGTIKEEVTIPVSRPVRLRVSPAGDDVAILGITSGDACSLYIYSFKKHSTTLVASGPFSDVSWDASSELLYLSAAPPLTDALFKVDLRSKAPMAKEFLKGIGITGCKEVHTFYYVDLHRDLLKCSGDLPAKLLLSKVPLLNREYFSYFKYTYGSKDKLLVSSFRIKSSEVFMLDPTNGDNWKILGDCGAKDFVAWIQK